MPGLFVAAEGSRLPDLSAVTVSWERGGGKLDLFSGPARPDAGGKFQVLTFLGESRRLIVSRLGAAAYVKEILYNGAPVKDGLVPLDGIAMDHSLTIMLDDKPAVIAGVVMNDDRPVSRGPDDLGEVAASGRRRTGKRYRLRQVR